MKKRLTRNLSLKIVSVLAAILIWLFASSASDPVIRAEYDVKVEVANDDYITDSGKTYQIEDADREVKVYVNGKTSVVSNRESDIVAVADMHQIVEMDEDADVVYVPVEVKETRGISMKNVDIYPKTIPVSIEEVETKEFVVTVNTTGTPAAGYVIGECEPAMEKISIRGPESTVNKIKSVVATINISGMDTDSERSAKITLMDQNGEATVTEDAKEYLNLIGLKEDGTMDVNVDLWRVVDNIKVSASYSGTPAPGYEVEKITTTPETISVAGSEEALVKLAENGNTVEIPASLINVEGSNQDLEANIKLNSLLKEEDGFKIPENMAQSLLVRVSILPYGSKEFEVDTSDIIISGLGENLKVMFTQGSVIVRVKGTEADLEQLKAKDIKASVDLTDKVAGEYSVPVTVKLPEGYEQVENTLATIQLAKTENTKE